MCKNAHFCQKIEKKATHLKCEIKFLYQTSVFVKFCTWLKKENKAEIGGKVLELEKYIILMSRHMVWNFSHI